MMEFFQLLRVVPDIQRFPIVHMVKTHFQFWYNSALPNIKYNCTVLFLSQLY